MRKAKMRRTYVAQMAVKTRRKECRGRPAKVAEPAGGYAAEVDREEYIKILEAEMAEAAEALDFERAALLRDQLFELRAAHGGRGVSSGG